MILNALDKHLEGVTVVYERNNVLNTFVCEEPFESKDGICDSRV